MMYFNSYGNPFFTIRKNSVRLKMMSIELFWINIKKEHKIHYHFFGIFETLIKILNKEISIKKNEKNIISIFNITGFIGVQPDQL
mgnify:CR=1 FL=1